MTRAEVAVAAGVGALVGGLVGALIAGAIANDVNVGSLAEWASGIGTVGALVLTYLLLRHEVGARRRDEAEALSRQARQVSVNAGGGVNGTIADPATGALHLPATLEMNAHVLNASGESIRSCRVDFLVAGDVVDTADLGVIAARGHADPRSKLSWSTQEQHPPVSAVLYFTDANGVEWRRHSDGWLERADIE